MSNLSLESFFWPLGPYRCITVFGQIKLECNLECMYNHLKVRHGCDVEHEIMNLDVGWIVLETLNIVIEC